MRFLGSVAGLIAGLGAAVLLVTYAVVPASSWLVLAAPIAGALLGFVAAWPRRPATPQEAGGG